MDRLTLYVLLVSTVALASCGGGNGDSASPATSPAPAQTTGATTAITSSPTTTLDPLDEAMSDLVEVPVPPEAREAINTLCRGFELDDLDAINMIAADLDETPWVIPAFEAICPEQVDKVGTMLMPSGDPVFSGYPVLVATSSVDERVANWASTDQLVALAPGVYAEYNPAVPELWWYLTGPTMGDCAVRDRYFPNSGGTCWSGVLPGTEEPPQ